jgi:hypothetical protein
MNPYQYAGPPTDPELLAKAGIGKVEPKDGSIKVLCDRCEEPVFIGPNIFMNLKIHPGDVLCFACVVEANAGIEVNVVPLGPGGHKFTKL